MYRGLFYRSIDSSLFSLSSFSFSRVDLVDLSREGEGFVGDFNAFEKALLLLLNEKVGRIGKVRKLRGARLSSARSITVLFYLIDYWPDLLLGRVAIY